MMVYRDFYGNTVHHFDIPERHKAIEIMAQAIVDVLPTHELDPAAIGDWDELDRRVRSTDYWEMMVPSHFATPTPSARKTRGGIRFAAAAGIRWTYCAN